MNYQNDLNENQYNAVTTEAQHVRVIAGAGSGKTRVLTYRIAYLIGEMHVEPWKILAITFTNKVANEMKNRVINLVPEANRFLTIKTFHSFAAYFLRNEISILGFPASFSILDEEDQTKLIKDIAEEMGYKRGDKIVAETLSYIGKMKLQEKYPNDIDVSNLIYAREKDYLDIYQRYEEEKDKCLVLDFDDLLLKTNYILENYPNIRAKWQSFISHILIDEFQDTNDVEYKMIRFLMKPSTCLYVVGDPDQTIYTWRGANQDIILNLKDAFPKIVTIVLNRNYRSTQTILDTANKLICHNKLRVKKDLYTTNQGGKDVIVYSATNVKNEADYVAREINRLKTIDGYSFRDIAVIYRSNYLSRDFEKALMLHSIPYRIFGGSKFYQRMEVKDVLAYFRLVVNPKDDIAFSRIINIPRRGIGETTENRIKRLATESKKSLYEFIAEEQCEGSSPLSKAINSLKAMTISIDITRDEISKNEKSFSMVLRDLIWSIGYYDYLKSVEGDDDEERKENVEALFEDILFFLKNNPDATFEEYLQNVALLSAQDEISDGDYITLMTAHIAKGLEYPIVFIVRLNDRVFPNSRTVEENGFYGLEEERRLAYVAMTRAKKRLYLTLPNGDVNFVKGGYNTPSQFLRESGNDVPLRFQSLSGCDDYSPFKPKKQTSYHFDDGDHLTFENEAPIKQNLDDDRNDVDDWKVGDIVIHKKLGRGVVIELEGDDIIKVDFKDHGIKSILGTHPSVSKGGHDA